MSEHDLHATLTATLNSSQRKQIYEASSAGSLRPIRPGAYVDPAEWESVFLDDRIRARANAVAARAVGAPPVFGGTTAAAVMRLPVVWLPNDRVHVIARGENPQKSRGDVVRHNWPLPLDDIEARDGLLITVLSRTVYDVIRETRPETAIVVCDAALRLVAWNEEAHSIDTALSDAFRAELWRRIDRGAGARGIRQAREIVRIADGRAQLSGEAISRLWMRQLGAPLPILQHPVRCGIRAYFLDFAWPRLKLWGEFDGRGKYFDAGMTAGRSFEQVLEAQRRRQNDIERATGWTAVRWTNAELQTIEGFAKFLRRSRILA